MNPAPIVLFPYPRFDALYQTIDALKQNFLSTESDLYIFSDAATNPSDIALVNNVRSYLKTIVGFKSINIHEAPHNKGLANSIIGGVSAVLAEHETVIVLEDDLITTSNFLGFMNQCLNKYRHNHDVFSVSGYSFNLGQPPENTQDIYFLNRGWSWGWATWKDRWENVDWSMKDYPEFRKNKTLRLDFAKGGSDLNGMLKKQMDNKIDSWAIRWFYHQFMAKGLTVYPILSKVHNNGFDENATHTKSASTRYLPVMDSGNKQDFNLPMHVELYKTFQKRFQRKMGVNARIKSKLEGLFNYLRR